MVEHLPSKVRGPEFKPKYPPKRRKRERERGREREREESYTFCIFRLLVAHACNPRFLGG
jgi:hypothetical protein